MTKNGSVKGYITIDKKYGPLYGYGKDHRISRKKIYLCYKFYAYQESLNFDFKNIAIKIINLIHFDLTFELSITLLLPKATGHAVNGRNLKWPQAGHCMVEVGKSFVSAGGYYQKVRTMFIIS